MKTTIQSATAILGPELIKAFHDSCKGNKREIEAMIYEAMKALRFARLDEDWQDDNLIVSSHNLNY